MFRLVLRRFVRDPDDVNDPAVRRVAGTLSAVVGILINLLLFAAKFTVGVLCGSLSVRADAVNNLSDAGSSVISLVSFRISAKPADRGHPYGHARVEYIASMIISFFVLLVGAELVKSSVAKLLSPVPITPDVLTFAVLGGSVLCKLWMCFFNRKWGKKLDSEVLRATSADSLSDAIATGAVLLANLAALILPEAARPYADPVMGLAVAVLILMAGLRVLNDTKNSLIGGAPDPKILQTIRKMVAEYPEILGIHDLMVHSYGKGYTFASFHAEVDGKKDIFATHDTVDLIEKRLYDEHHISCTVHMDPIVTDDPVLEEWKEKTERFAKILDPRLRIHDFRMVPGTTHTNLIFDVAAPFEAALTDREIREKLAGMIGKEDPHFYTVITVDRV